LEHQSLDSLPGVLEGENNGKTVPTLFVRFVPFVAKDVMASGSGAKRGAA
jgi:hypothetical protein